MKSPSIYLTDIDSNGCVLVYRSARQGFTQYVMGSDSQTLFTSQSNNLTCRPIATNRQRFLQPQIESHGSRQS
jgi:hypothetical protein